jgi:hypothetical protein
MTTSAPMPDPAMSDPESASRDFSVVYKAMGGAGSPEVASHMLRDTLTAHIHVIASLFLSGQEVELEPVSLAFSTVDRFGTETRPREDLLDDLTTALRGQREPAEVGLIMTESQFDRRFVGGEQVTIKGLGTIGPGSDFGEFRDELWRSEPERILHDLQALPRRYPLVGGRRRSRFVAAKVAQLRASVQVRRPRSYRVVLDTIEPIPRRADEDNDRPSRSL